jgi:hypothetical protein
VHTVVEAWFPGGRIATALSFTKAELTGQAYSGGEHETVRL